MKYSVSQSSQRLIKLTACSWCALIAVGSVIKLLLPLPAVTLLLDRSYCAPDQWQQVSEAYAELYRQHQQQRSHLQGVIIFSSLNQTSYENPPHPNVVESLTTYGQFDQQRQTTLEETYDRTIMLSCHKLL